MIAEERETAGFVPPEDEAQAGGMVETPLDATGPAAAQPIFQSPAKAMFQSDWLSQLM